MSTPSPVTIPTVGRRSVLLRGLPFVAGLIGCRQIAWPGRAAAQSAATSQADASHVGGVTAVTEVFGDGQKLTAVALRYDQPIANASLSPEAFAVPGRTVTRVSAASAPAKTAAGIDGPWVVVELSPDDAGASTLDDSGANGPGSAASAVGTPGTAPSGPPPAGGLTRRAVAVTVAQVGPVATVAGETYAPDPTAHANDAVLNLVVDDFAQRTFTDSETGGALAYNLYVPQGYDPAKRYPLVMFIHDASAVGTDPLLTLVQGLGAVVWATPEEQAKHEAFVLAPQYAVATVDDQSRTTADLETTVRLIAALQQEFAIDPARIYTTGQSMGCMSSIALLVAHPGLFGGAYLVAGQWDPAVVAPLAQDNLWIVVSQGDEKAFPGMNAITEVIEQQGTPVSRATWDARWDPAEFAAAVTAMEQAAARVNYAAFEPGTALPAGQSGSGSEHRNTWRVAYMIEGVRDWLFRQTTG